MKKIIASGAVALMLVAGSVAFAQTSDQDTADAAVTSGASGIAAVSSPVFPIAELGGCASKDECHAYCEDASHQGACFSYAQAHGLMTKEKIAAAKIILAKKGPGSCGSAGECRAYCADSAHQEECLTFAQDKKIISDDKLMLIKKLITGSGPGACKTSESCRAYCLDASHAGECKAFASENLRPRMGSSTPPAMRGAMGSSTQGKPASGMPPKYGSTTSASMNHEMEMRMKMGSTTVPGDVHKLFPPPGRPATTTRNDSLGATLLKGVAMLLGFY